MYKRKDFKKNPLKVIGKLLMGFLKSQAFILSNCVSQKKMFCLVGKPELTPLKAWLCGFFQAVPIFLESTSRIEEIAVWVLPRFFELVYNYSKKKNWIEKEIPGFLNILFALSIGAFCKVYTKNKSTVKSKYQTIGKMIIGDEPNIPSVNTLEKKYREGDSTIDSQKIINKNFSTDSLHAPIFPGPGFIN